MAEQRTPAQSSALSDRSVDSTSVEAWRSVRRLGPGDHLLQSRLDQVDAFKFVTEAKAPVYRAIVQVFADAKAHYVVELRPSEVLTQLSVSGLPDGIEDEAAVESALNQLDAWGNLHKSHDGARVQRIEDYYRKRYRYHLTAVGEAAHEAVLRVEKTLGKSGALQTGMLGRIADALRALLAAAPGDASRGDARAARAALFDIDAAFTSLTEEANRFIGDLDVSDTAERVEEERFLLYKRAVLAYLTTFVERLRGAAAEIAALVRELDSLGFEPLALLASAAAELPPQPDGRDPAPAWVAEACGRWQGVRAWFVGDANGAARVERLLEVALSAVLQLTHQLGRLNDRRVRAVDRAADFTALGRMFAACATDDEAHALWRLAFGLAPARHFHLAEDDEGAASPTASWWNSVPVQVPVRLRSHGAVSRAGRAAAVPDHGPERAWIAMQRRQELLATEAALARFVGRGPLHLSALGELGARELQALLDLLDELFAFPPDADGLRMVRTIDGRFDLALRPVAGRPWAEIRTEEGLITCRDAELSVAPAAGGERLEVWA